MYDLVLTMKKKKQVHLKTTNGFEYIWWKLKVAPGNKESKSEIDSIGNFKLKNNGLYYKSNNCNMS
jgi:hypothetical protein